MVGVQFENATTGAANTFNSLLKMQGISACSYDDMYTEGAEIQILVDGAYKKYYFINDQTSSKSIDKLDVFGLEIQANVNLSS